MSPSPSTTELRRRRLAAQRLHRPAATSVPALVHDLLAVQAQDQHAAALGLRARMPGLTLADVDAARQRGEVVVTWLMRGTLHLVSVRDLGWLHALTAERGQVGGERRLRQLGVADDADRAVSVIEEALAGGTPVTRPALVRRLAEAGIETGGQAAIHLIGLAARRRVCVLGADVDGSPAYVAWPDAIAPVDRDTALAELARRYLRAHGPATDDDLAGWSGLPLRDARAGLAAIADEITDAGGGLLVLVDAAGPQRMTPRLLPALDPYLLGWRDRTFAVATAHADDVAPGGGVVRATAVVDGEAVATWRATRRGDTLRVALDPFHTLRAADAGALRADAEDLARFERRRLVSEPATR